MGARILVVEDNEQNLQLTSFLLEAFGHLAIEARSGREGLERATRQEVDLVLLDIQMPEMDSLETLAEMRRLSELEGTPIVALTALAMVGDREIGLAAGFDGYITKPITPEGFAAEIDAFLPADRRSSLRPRRDGGSGAS
jgi:two-component system cell cycle response regulator